MSTPPIAIQNIVKKKSVINPTKTNDFKFECKTVPCMILPNEECTLQVNPESGDNIKTVPIYSIVCTDDLFNLTHYLKPLNMNDTSFEICVKNSTDQIRNISITYYII